MRLVRAAIAAAALTLLISIPAAAAQRYASPIGGGEACTKEAPCRIETAVDKAETGDEVIVGTGTYTLSTRLFPAPGVENLVVHGDTSGPMPKIVSPLNDRALRLGPGGNGSYLEVTATVEEATAIECEAGGSIERVSAMTSGDYAVTIFAIGGCPVRNSLALADGAHDFALLAAGEEEVSTVTGVTAIAGGSGSIAIQSVHSGGPVGAHPLALTDSIAAGSKADLAAPTSGSGSGQILASHSNFDSVETGDAHRVIDLGGNQSTAPSFVDAGFGDYREAAGSGTIDAGVTAASQGTLDLAGSARVLGAAPDIGAYEFVPPPAPSGGVRSISIKHTKRYRPLKGSFSEQGATGTNSFVFRGRIGGKKLKPGAYKLTAFAGHLVSAAFEIARHRKNHHRQG